LATQNEDFKRARNGTKKKKFPRIKKNGAIRKGKRNSKGDGPTWSKWGEKKKGSHTKMRADGREEQSDITEAVRTPC